MGYRLQCIEYSLSKEIEYYFLFHISLPQSPKKEPLQILRKYYTLMQLLNRNHSMCRNCDNMERGYKSQIIEELRQQNQDVPAC